MILEKVYEPKKVEEKIYHFWEKRGFFNPDKLPGQRKKKFSIVLPPPNVTGSLHMGHALNATIQDILIRWKRLQGFKTLWLPGTDHAGIATQVVVEKELKKERKTRFELGRERFVEKVWEWVKKYGGIILNQYKRLGCSLDWSRTRFTLDKNYSEAVMNAFFHYFKKGMIYQGERPVNWCKRCTTSLSDLELEHREEKTNLWYIKYPIKGEKNQFLTVATTRPETILGDSALAVNPKDRRYKKFLGKKAILPLVEREIPIVSHSLVDPKFGTGVVKVTPAHDFRDYEISLACGLKMIKVIDEEGKITKEAPQKYQGLLVEVAREKIVEDLKNLDLILKIEPYTHFLPVCDRCGTKIEILPSRQWFLKMKDLAKMAEKTVKSQKVKILPKRFEKIYFDWLKNIRDWCISRQIWWGHKIPAWECKIKKIPEKVMGFDQSLFWQVFKGKTITWRLRDHNFKVGEEVAFKISQTGEIFGFGRIRGVEKTTVKELNLKDKDHYRTYKSINEVIEAFKRFNPHLEVTENTPVFVYRYSFRKITEKDGGCGKIIVSRKKPKKCPNCGSKDLLPISDVLDTWFSSALWPFATLGWPKKKKDLKNFYPTDVLVTGRDIINLWVTRMIFSGLEFMKKEPFKFAFINPTVLTKEGKRMSKSLGTGIDPMVLIEKYGTDATRFGLVWQVKKGQDLKFDESTIQTGRKFCNKIWNASRFILMNIGERRLSLKKFQIKNEKLTEADKRILKSLEKIKRTVNKNLENFEFGKAIENLYHFFWHEFCDKYIEISKKQMKDKKLKKQTQKILLALLLNSLILLHPFLPFLTEEVYQRMPLKNKKISLMIENWSK